MRLLMGVGVDHPVAALEVDDPRIALAVVGQVDDEALLRIRELSLAHERVLAIAVGDVAPRVLLDAGASDVVVWRGDPAPIHARIARWQLVETLLDSAIVRANLVGSSRKWRRLLRDIVELAHCTTASMLLAGESGTGKELLARLVHTLDARPDKGELVVVDCTTIVESLSGSELFGHERGAYTGATGARDGAFALADRGTLFLDEVGELPLSLQAQLLRAIQERTYKRVGGNDWQRAEFRLVCATHRDLAAAVARGEFRHDLYHRIATWTLEVPALADRRDDIPALVAHFLGEAIELDPDVERYLVERAYPGNVRELGHTVQRLVDRWPGAGPITIGQIPEAERACLGRTVWPDDAFEHAIRTAITTGVGLKSIGRTAEDLAVRIALALESGNVPKASRRLGVTERALQLRQAARREQE